MEDAEFSFFKNILFCSAKLEALGCSEAVLTKNSAEHWREHPNTNNSEISNPNEFS